MSKPDVRSDDHLGVRPGDEPETTRYELTLFVSGASALSAGAIASARQVCEVHLDGPYDLSIVDVNEDPSADLSWILAVPTLVRIHPPPVRKVVGDLSHAARVLLALELPVVQDAPSAVG